MDDDQPRASDPNPGSQGHEHSARRDEPRYRIARIHPLRCEGGCEREVVSLFEVSFRVGERRIRRLRCRRCIAQLLLDEKYGQGMDRVRGVDIGTERMNAYKIALRTAQAGLAR
ncbi:MAG TPA: hypothetical protein DCK98_09980 [Chloroflexi bacterium]|jgi:hypothetical protein|nr:hypothetical protein [Chloroflexota bacterium]HAL26353.1 hypothetical protein [Chloroflexota bacterium]